MEHSRAILTVLKIIFFPWYEYRMGRKTLKFGNVEIEKQRFYSSKSPIDLDDVINDKI